MNKLLHQYFVELFIYIYGKDNPKLNNKDTKTKTVIYGYFCNFQLRGSQQSTEAITTEDEEMVAVAMMDKDKLQLINGGKATQRALRKAVG